MGLAAAKVTGARRRGAGGLTAAGERLTGGRGGRSRLGRACWLGFLPPGRKEWASVAAAGKKEVVAAQNMNQAKHQFFSMS